MKIRKDAGPRGGRTYRCERGRGRDADTTWFRCIHCGQSVLPDAPGTQHRNHCPWCLWSRHVDDEAPGDRASECRAPMEPVAVWARPGGDWAVIHRCRGCGALHSNRIAGDDNELALVALAAKALAQPPFPISRIATLAAVKERPAPGEAAFPPSAEAD